MRRHRLSCLPEEPLKNACVARMSVADNLAFRDFDRAPFAAGGWWLQRAASRGDLRDGQAKLTGATSMSIDIERQRQ